jgi:hypothetical protein
MACLPPNFHGQHVRPGCLNDGLAIGAGLENLIQWVGLGGEVEVRAWTDGVLDGGAKGNRVK